MSNRFTYYSILSVIITRSALMQFFLSLKINTTRIELHLVLLPLPILSFHLSYGTAQQLFAAHEEFPQTWVSRLFSTANISSSTRKFPTVCRNDKICILLPIPGDSGFDPKLKC